MDLPFITTGPAPPHPHTHTVVFLHGRGDSADAFVRSLGDWRDAQNRTLADAFPSFRWVLPRAPLRRCAAGPDVLWPQWFDVWDVRDFARHQDLQAVGLREVVPALRRLLASEAGALGGRWDRVVLAGISMGAATGVHALFHLAEPLGAFMAFSARCPFAGRGLAQMREVLGLEEGPKGRENEVLRRTPVLMEHCADDPLVLVQDGRGLRDTLASFGARVEWREYPSGGHWFNKPAGVDDAVLFLEKYVVGPYRESEQGGGADAGAAE
ncbi:phospholipase/carboxylesterase family protein [Xylariaceae sp. FL0016]|nr:phospholipase/carboxylesterase family protein [Xylariaceae sp. FL0016]